MKLFQKPATRLIVILLLAIACGVITNQVRREHLPWRGEWSRHIENRALHAGMKLVGIRTMQQAVATKVPRLLDARPSADFRAGHISGAQSLPFDLAAEMLAGMQIELARDQSLITYCARHDCDEGLELALFLRRVGYTNVTLFAGGLAEWRAAGGAVEID